MDTDELPAHLQLSLFTGEIVIHDSWAEHEARVLWRVLNDAGFASGKRPEMFGRLLPNLQQSLEAAAVPSGLRDIGLPLIESTRKWHQYRTDLVHDLLTTGWGPDGEVQSALGKHPPRSLVEMKECSAELQRSGYRLRGLYVIAPYWLTGTGDPWESADGLRSWTRVAMGHIADVPNEIRGTVGPAPEPPRGWETIIEEAVRKREPEDARLDSFHVTLDEPDE